MPVNGLDFFFRGYFQSVGDMFGFHICVVVLLFLVGHSAWRIAKEFWR